MPDTLCITYTSKGILFAIKVLPRSSKNMFAGIHDNALKIKLTSAPVDGKANTALISFLSKQLKISKNSISITRGETSTRKQILLSTSNPEVAKKLQQLAKR